MTSCYIPDKSPLISDWNRVQKVVPSAYLQHVLSAAHESKWTGQLGIRKTLADPQTLLLPVFKELPQLPCLPDYWQTKSKYPSSPAAFHTLNRRAMWYQWIVLDHCETITLRNIWMGHVQRTHFSTGITNGSLFAHNISHTQGKKFILAKRVKLGSLDQKR